ncbi:hypothetical protein [Roseimicrobium sp. ORNL1]|uniref:hypothetical protein n=1 Tax=Roseimicrobium sp. ORNL1 TaxID=2711231 RepID=UPI0013E14D26|nr:hypothetical protein [Roseimicrobium sp. ORNL1]QIF02063.1 hypothetical protein G5S37_11145 [Roseimicrobium sp. ORNL1]
MTLATTLLIPSFTSAQQGIQVLQGGFIPASPQMKRDKAGNDWYVEQNGQISRNSSGNSILSGAMMLMIGNDQFYCNQAMGSPDGKDLMLQGSQPMMGAIQVTRHIRFLEKEGGLRYLEVFTNPTARDISMNVELRQNFSSQVKSILTDRARESTGILEKTETGVAVVPGSAGTNAWLFTYCSPQSLVKPRISAQNQRYQMSAFFNITVPAGKSTAFMHTVTQSRLSVRPDASDLEKAFKPFALVRHLRDLPKGTAPILVNLRGGGGGALDLASWFPEELLGIKREAVDVLAMGEGTRLRGRATCARLSLTHRNGKAEIPWAQVAAIAGARHEGGQRVYLADGQILRGTLEAEELKFILGSGLQMDMKIAALDRLVLAQQGAPTQWPSGVAALLETWNGERWALRDAGATTFKLSTAWGQREVKLADLVGISSPSEEGATPLAAFRDGSRLRVWTGSQDSVEFTSTLLGKQTILGTQLRALVVATAPTSTSSSSGEETFDEDAGPMVPFADLPADQRLVAPVADAVLHAVTTGGVVPIDPAGIKEMRNVTEDIAQTGADDSPWFQIELWGGGSVLGQLRESSVRFRAPDGEWTVPTQEILRIANPVPKIAEATISRVGQLIRDLGHQDWKVREKATGELRLLGELAKPSLQEALKQSEDPEVKRRLETVLGEME